MQSIGKFFGTGSDGRADSGLMQGLGRAIGAIGRSTSTSSLLHGYSAVSTVTGTESSAVVNTAANTTTAANTIVDPGLVNKPTNPDDVTITDFRGKVISYHHHVKYYKIRAGLYKQKLPFGSNAFRDYIIELEKEWATIDWLGYCTRERLDALYARLKYERLNKNASVPPFASVINLSETSRGKPQVDPKTGVRPTRLPPHPYRYIFHSFRFNDEVEVMYAISFTLMCIFIGHRYNGDIQRRDKLTELKREMNQIFPMVMNLCYRHPVTFTLVHSGL